MWPIRDCFFTKFYVDEVPKLLTESQVQRSFQKLVNSGELTDVTFEKAEALLEELRPESPLRHRLGVQLEELRTVAAKS